MHEIIKIPVSKTMPSAEIILKAQGVPAEETTISETLIPMAQQAVAIYRNQAAPKGKILEISKIDFEQVYFGKGLNDKSTPLDKIFQAADHLSLFAVTIGENINLKIGEYFKSQEFALGAMLDSAASEGVELAANELENRYRNYLPREALSNSVPATMQFSPGYCGWHISGQKRLFEYLRPEDIGITLNESYLMSPLKAVTGVIVAGNKNIFKFDDDFPCCEHCETRSCRNRIKALFEN